MNRYPNKPGHVDRKTGRVAITVAQAFDRDDVDSPLWLFKPHALQVGLDPWVRIDGVDASTDRLRFDVWTVAGRLHTMKPSGCVYVQAAEGAAILASKEQSTCR